MGLLKNAKKKKKAVSDTLFHLNQLCPIHIWSSWCVGYQGQNGEAVQANSLKPVLCCLCMYSDEGIPFMFSLPTHDPDMVFFFLEFPGAGQVVQQQQTSALAARQPPTKSLQQNGNVSSGMELFHLGWMVMSKEGSVLNGTEKWLENYFYIG